MSKIGRGLSFCATAKVFWYLVLRAFGKLIKTLIMHSSSHVHAELGAYTPLGSTQMYCFMHACAVESSSLLDTRNIQQQLATSTN